MVDFTMMRFILVLMCTFSFAFSQIPRTCKKLNSCACEDEHGRIVNLTTLVTDVKPRFKDYHTAGGENNTYSWNPCYSFDEGPDNGGCKNVGACMISPSGKYTGIGRTETVEFSHDDNGNLTIVMTQGNGDSKQETHVILYCDETVEAHFRVVGLMSTRFYWLQLWSKHNCPKPKEKLISTAADMTFPVSDPVTVPTHPTPGVVTVTAGPSPHSHAVKDIEIILLCILIMVALILAVLLTRFTIKSSKNSNSGTVRYRALPQYEPHEHDPYDVKMLT